MCVCLLYVSFARFETMVASLIPSIFVDGFTQVLRRPSDLQTHLEVKADHAGDQNAAHQMLVRHATDK